METEGQLNYKVCQINSKVVEKVVMFSKLQTFWYNQYQTAMMNHLKLNSAFARDV